LVDDLNSNIKIVRERAFEYLSEVCEVHDNTFSDIRYFISNADTADKGGRYRRIYEKIHSSFPQRGEDVPCIVTLNGNRTVTSTIEIYGAALASIKDGNITQNEPLNAFLHLSCSPDRRTRSSARFALSMLYRDNPVAVCCAITSRLGMPQDEIVRNVEENVMILENINPIIPPLVHGNPNIDENQVAFIRLLILQLRNLS